MSATPLISGFTILRHGVQFDYPFEQSIESLLPLVDELVVNVGIGEDATLARLQEMQRTHPKIVLFESHWPLNDPEKKRGGQILAEQTNLALDRCKHDWCLYLQADEVLHEEDRERLLSTLAKAHQDPNVDGVLFDYIHFYGSYDVIQHSRSVYRREVRLVRKSSGARSVGDAQSFRKDGGVKLTVLRSGARVFHYGGVRTPEAMREKTFFMDQLYHGAPTSEQLKTRTPHTGENYRYKKILGLRRFQATHPATMKTRIAQKGWSWDLSRSPLEWSFKDLKKMLLDGVERLTGARFFEYRSYRLRGGGGRW